MCWSYPAPDDHDFRKQCHPSSCMREGLPIQRLHAAMQVFAVWSIGSDSPFSFIRPMSLNMDWSSWTGLFSLERSQFAKQKALSIFGSLYAMCCLLIQRHNGYYCCKRLECKSMWPVLWVPRFRIHKVVHSPTTLGWYRLFIMLRFFFYGTFATSTAGLTAATSYQLLFSFLREA